MANTFVELNDTPSDYSGQAGKFLVVDDTEGNVVYADISGTAGEITFVNNTINLVATGVTAATYGNATHSPQITVDSYGRIQNVDLVEVTAAGNVANSTVTEAYKYVAVSGQTTLAADTAQDTLTIVAGTGISLSTTASTDTLTISTVNDPDNFNADVDAFLTTNSYSNVAYGNTEVQTYLDAQGYSNVDNDVQTLIWDDANSNLSISDGNTVTITFNEYTDANVDTFLTSNGYSNVVSNYGNTDVQAYLESNTTANFGDVTANTITVGYEDILKIDTGVEERFTSYSSSTGIVTQDCHTGQIFRHTTPTSDFTVNFTNLALPTGYTTTITLIIEQSSAAYIAGGVQIGGAPQTIRWQGGIAPIGTPSGIDALSFTILNLGVGYRVLGQLVDFS